MFFGKPRNLIVLVIVVLTFILRFPTFFEPYWYGDELIRLIVANQWFSGKSLYSEIFDNSPPLLYLIFGLAKNLFWLKILAFIWVVAAAIIFYFLAKDLGKNLKLKKTFPVLATLIFILITSTPLFEGNIAAAEIFALFPVVSAMLLVWEVKASFKFYQSVLAGILFAAATLVRLQSIADMLAAVTIFLLVFKNFRSIFLLSLGFVIAWLGTFLFFISTGNFGSFISSVFLGNFNYVNFANQLGVPFGLIFLKFAILILLSFIILKFRKFLPNAEIFILFWLVFSLFGASIGGRSYLHYFLQLTPAVSLLAAQIVKVNLTTLTKFLTIMSFFIILFFLGKFHSKFFGYYTNFFAAFYNHQKYISWFDSRIIQSETIANYVAARTDSGDTILVLGNAPEIYLLSQRQPAGAYVVSYHLNFQMGAKFKTLKEVTQNQPKIIILFEEGKEEIPQITSILPKFYKLNFQIGTAQVWEKPL